MSQTIAHDLRRETDAARMLLSSYASILADDDEATSDAIEGETNLNETMRDGIARVLEINAMIEAGEATAKALKSRLQRLADQADMIKAALALALEISGRKRFECELATLSEKRVSPSLTITNEVDIPAEFWVAQDPKIDKRALLAALKAEREIPGAELSNGGVTVQIRTK